MLKAPQEARKKTMEYKTYSILPFEEQPRAGQGYSEASSIIEGKAPATFRAGAWLIFSIACEHGWAAGLGL